MFTYSQFLSRGRHSPEECCLHWIKGQVLLLFHFLSPFSLTVLSEAGSNPLPSLKMEEQQGSKIGDDIIWLGLPYNKHVVTYILGVGWLWDLTFPWEITFIGLKWNEIIGNRDCFEQRVFQLPPYLPWRTLTLSVKLFPVKGDDLFLHIQFFQDTGLCWVLAYNIVVFVPFQICLEISEGGSVPSSSGSALPCIFRR